MSVPKGFIMRDSDFKKDSLELAVIIDSIYGEIMDRGIYEMEGWNFIAGESLGELIVEAMRKSGSIPSSDKKEFYAGLKSVL